MDTDASSAFSKRGFLTAAVAIVALVLIVAPIGLWPWDHDEVHGLMELGLVPLDAYPGPIAQLERMHRLVPVFYVLQRGAALVVPQTEWGMRLMPSLCGALVTVFAFVIGARARGTWFGLSLFIMLVGSQTLVWLAQQNRFYPLALLLAAISLALVWVRNTSWTIDLAAIALGVASVLSHNLTLLLFGFSFVSLAATWVVGWTPRLPVRRAFGVAVATAVVYVFYLRPLTVGWLSGNTGGTSPLLSFIAQIGLTPIALAVPGAIAAFEKKEAPFWSSWVVFAALCLAFVALSPQILGNWNPRYGLFFMVPVWMLAAFGSEVVMRRLETDTLRLAWLVAVVLLLAPKLASHYIDGSRHDFRSAAAIVAARGAQGETILSNWPAELQYYLRPKTGQQARYWSPGERIPDAPSLIVMASNAWEPVVQVPGRDVRVIGEVGTRRFDEQSHLIRIYEVGPRQSISSR
jgi:hypothetical protein